MHSDISRVIHHLERLVAIPSVSADGTLEIADYVARVLSDAGHTVEVLPDENGRDANILAHNSQQPALVLSAHLDVVPVTGQDWASAPFSLSGRNGLFYGRGTTDMKGFIALTLALAERRNLPPLVWAFSWGEEIGCQGIRKLLPRLTELCPWGCIVGEPTRFVPVVAHKGRTAFKIFMRGLPVHSSRSDIGRNAIHAMGHLINVVDRLNADFARHGPFAGGFQPAHSTLQVNMVTGGRAPNIVAGEAEALIEMRVIPGDNPDLVLEHLRKTVSQLDVETTITPDTSTPPFDADTDSAIVGIACEVTGNAVTSAPFSTEAGLIQRTGIPTIVCGPGSIEQAHIANEFISHADLETGVRFFDQLMHKLQILKGTTR